MIGPEVSEACDDLIVGTARDPAYTTALHQLSSQAELVVVGKRRSSPLAQFFTGSVAQRLAKWAAGDVLIAPFDQRGVVTTADRL